MLAVVAAPFVFPSYFWKKTSNDDNDINVVFYEVNKNSENPYLKEKTVVCLYDLNREMVYSTSSTKNETSASDELSQIVKDIFKASKKVFFVSYDDGLSKEVFLKNLVENSSSLNTINIKQLFYFVHDNVPDINYDKILEYYKIEKKEFGNAECIEYSEVFSNLIQDYDMNIHNEMHKLSYMHEEMMNN